MIVCTHEHRGGQNVVTPEWCGKRARFVVPKIIQYVAGNRVAMQVCGVHRRFWESRGYETEPLGAAEAGKRKNKK